MSEGNDNVLFHCAGNSTRSILAESILNPIGAGRFHAHSDGSHPKGEVHPQALDLLKRFSYVTNNIRSRDWSEFAQSGAPDLDVVVNVCDNARGEACPIWPGQPVTAHWGIEDRAAVTGSAEKQRQALKNAYCHMERRIQIFINPPMASMNKPTLESRLVAIGKTSDSRGSAA